MDSVEAAPRSSLGNVVAAAHDVLDADIDYYETGYLPVRSLLSRRFFELSGRRLRELIAFSEAAARYMYTRHVARTPLKPKMFFGKARGKRRASAGPSPAR